MSTNLEIEFKAELSRNDYESLILKYKNESICQQINYYFDTPTLAIRNAKCGLRVREKNNELELTLKVDQKEGKLEINQNISTLFRVGKEFPDGEVKNYIENNLGIETKDINILGKLVTNRLDIRYMSALISIDESLYNGTRDYEIEIEDESMELAKIHLQKFLEENNIEYKKSPGSKLRRFLATL